MGTVERRKDKSILLFRLGGLGDLLTAFPSIFFLRKKFPSYYFFLVCRKIYGQILKEMEIIDEVISFEGRKFCEMFMDVRDPSSEITSWLKAFDWVMGWMQQNQNFLEQFFRRSKIYKGKYCFISYDEKCGQPISQFFFERTIHFFGEDDERELSLEEFSRLPVKSDQEKMALGLLQKEKVIRTDEKLAVVHPGSGNREKCWPLAHYWEIISRLQKVGFEGAIVTGEAETYLREEIQKRALPSGWKWLNIPSLMALAGLMKLATFYLGNDSGITHLAASCGTRVVALFQKKFALPWRPFGRSKVIASESVLDIGVETVWEVILQILEQA